MYSSHSARTDSISSYSVTFPGFSLLFKLNDVKAIISSKEYKFRSLLHPVFQQDRDLT